MAATTGQCLSSRRLPRESFKVHPVGSSINADVKGIADAARAVLVVVGLPEGGHPVPALNVPLPIALVADGERPVVVLGAEAELQMGSGHYELAAGVH